MLKTKYIIAFCLIIFTFSCSRIKWTSTKGNLKTTDKFWRYPNRSTSNIKRGVKIVVDTVENYLVSKTRYKHSNGCFNQYVIRQKTIKYNKEQKRIEKYVYRNGKEKTTRYINNLSKIRVPIDTINAQRQ